MLAASAQILTSRPDKLTAENVTTAAEIANTLLLSPNATESVRVAAIATVSQLLDASAPVNTEENNTISRLTVTLEQLSVNQSVDLNTSQSQVVQPNLVIQSAQIPAENTQGVQFTSLKGATGSFVADRIQLNTNTSEIVVENGFIADVLIYVRFPPAVSGQRKPSNVSLGFVLYQNDHFFRSRLYRRQQSTSIRVLSASVKGQGRAVVPQHVEMLFRPTITAKTKLYDYACVFWDYSLGDWSTQGCTKDNASEGVLRCFCNHTTNFAALMSFREHHEYAEALNYISIIGLSFSIIGLIITIIHRIRESFQRKTQESWNSTIVLVSICISLLAFIITFLSGVNNPNKASSTQMEATNTETNGIPGSDVHTEPDHGPCTAVAALLHFFLLAAFVWNAVFGTQLVLLIQKTRLSLPPSCTFLSITIGWGIPAVIVAITLGATYRVNRPLGYRREEFTRRTSLRKKFLISFSVAVLLGLSWILGYLVLSTSNEQGVAHLILSIVFCLCTTTQVFILFTARTRTFKKAVSRSIECISFASIHLHNRKYILRKDQGMQSTEAYKDMTYDQD
ncbi:adhesion G-protein coupled receptor G7 [Centroberyx affinis]|uniref:adhesion G-protein coupled receptor G7 n=1 Tax=Centroberyx affinis TaxID=166261 RepID=UPI003A5BAAC4